MIRTAALLTVLSSVGWADIAFAQPPHLEAIRADKTASALAVDEPIAIDGLLNEPAWERAPAATDFYQQQPPEFELATRRTEVRFLSDRTTLYVGAILFVSISFHSLQPSS